GGLRGATVIDALDTLYIMELEEEFQEAKQWVEKSFDLNVNGEASLFEVNIRYIGGLLATYYLTGEEVFKNKALELGEKLLPAFNTPTGIPRGVINLGRQGTHPHPSSFSWSLGIWGGAAAAPQSCPSRADSSRSLALPAQTLAQTAGDSGQTQLFYLFGAVQFPPLPPDRAFSSLIFFGSHYPALSPNLLLGSAKQNTCTHLADAAVSQISLSPLLSDVLLIPGKIGATQRCNCPFVQHTHPASSVPDKGSAQANLSRNAKPSPALYTKLGPEAFRFDAGSEAMATRLSERYYILRPEVVESYMYLWRLTHEPKYRHWGWEVVQALEKHCRVEAGFSGIRDVYTTTPTHDNMQQSFFLAETLKYLYLLFCEDDVLSLEDWVFNTEAHPLPINHTDFRA
ncbi:MA1C1 mannosidase, partial [Acrocephalus arundinaceus]|nr:MA1C1 mannosidase [Acrocephalus arundinaceus]